MVSSCSLSVFVVSYLIDEQKLWKTIMYKTSDYLRNGVLYLNNIIRPHHKRLSTLMIYSTTKCQSRCKHCSIWQKPEEHLSLRMIKMIMASQCVTKNTVVGLEGGEFLLHPEANAIMEWFKDNHPNYTLLSNCLAPQKVIEAVRLYHPSHLYVSLDGNKETYKAMRGCNGHDKVLEVIETLKDEVPVSLMFCLSPWNTFEDMDYVIGLAKRYDVDVRIGIYGTMDFLTPLPTCFLPIWPITFRISPRAFMAQKKILTLWHCIRNGEMVVCVYVAKAYLANWSFIPTVMCRCARIWA